MLYSEKHETSVKERFIYSYYQEILKMGGEVCELCKGNLVKVEQRIFEDESEYDILKCDKCNRKIVRRVE